MSLQFPGRRRTVGNRSNTNKSCNHGCDCGPANNSSNSKYRPNRPIDASALFKRILPFAIFFGGIMVFRSRSSSLPSVLSSSNSKHKHKNTVGNCELRKYPKRRYYGLNDRPLPDFLQTEYLYGELPRILHPSEVMQNPHPTTKICVDQSEWYDPKKSTTKDDPTTTATLPFVDGTNPSILKLTDNPRIDPSIREFFGKDVYYLATICMTDGQCSWNDSPEEIAEFHLSEDKKPSTVHTVLLLLNKNFETIQEATIHTKIDAKFGRIKPNNNNQMKTFKLDDARLFTHNGKIWVSYREGKHFGYDKQVLNKVHFEFTDGSSGGGGGNDSDTKGLRTNNNKEQLTVTLLASDTETLCCGRNMALLDNVHTNQLQALTWVDPVTVVDVDVSKTDVADQVQEQQRRRLSKEDKKKKSHFHGTNGFMVHLPKTGEYLGIGHFHRPPGRDKNDYARFGHHYTHAFFTITDKPPFRLNRLSAELVLSSDSYPDDADIIQFWSGLELSTGFDGKEDSMLALAYGINDCEGAAIHLELAFVDGLLRDVPIGKEVVDFMMPLK